MATRRREWPPELPQRVVPLSRNRTLNVARESGRWVVNVRRKARHRDERSGWFTESGLSLDLVIARALGEADGSNVAREIAVYVADVLYREV